MMHKLKECIPYLMPVISAILLLFILDSVSPISFGPAGILIVLGLMYVFIASVLFVFAKSLLKLGSYFSFVSLAQPKKVYRMIYVIALGPIFLLALNSLGQLEIKDFILVIILIGLGCFYISRQTSE